MIISKHKEEKRKEMQQFVTRQIKTYVPYLVGLIISWLALAGIEVPADVQAWLGGLFTFAFGSLYYFIVVALAKKFPKLEWLLGVPTKPVYEKK